MTGDLIPANVLATHTIANVSETLAEKLGLPRQYRSIGIITACLLYTSPSPRD